MTAIAIIPARYAATRLPGKLILPEAKEITGKYIIEHVYCNTCRAKTLDKVVIATDDGRIYNLVKEFGGKVEMTPSGLESGTDRIAWVLKNVSWLKELNPDIVVNVQGDEPDISGDIIDEVVMALSRDQEAVMSTIAHTIESREEFEDPNAVKVVLDNENNALYFSRASIPFDRDGVLKDGYADNCNLLKHIGLYAYKKNFLLKYSDLPESALEKLEGLEQLRALSNGYRIKVAITDYKSVGIDTREDLDRFLLPYRK